jgi:tRNA(Ile)-lysidine synthase
MTAAPLVALSEAAEPATAAEFAQSLEAFAPFEPAPRLAVAVSGGSDSMALMLLARDWAQARGGRVFALTVDHGLRAESAAEARQVAARCAALGIDHATLRWEGPRPSSGIEAAAREARYRLLEDWCAEHGVLHLLLAHQRDDQAETVLMRLRRGSGAEGLAAMPSITERRDVRLLRPLLSMPRRRLRALLAASGEAWIDDPSNRDPAFLRARLRHEMEGLAARGLGSDRLAALARRFGAARMLAERDTAALLARAVELDPAGFAWLDRELIAAAPHAVATKALASVIATVAGTYYPPRTERAERLLAALCEGLASGRSLGGCLVLPRRGRVLICREPAAMAAPVTLLPGAEAVWDGRFAVNLRPELPSGLTLGGLGETAPAALDPAARGALAALPAAARPGLACLRRAGEIVALPALRHEAEGWRKLALPAVIFRPTRPLTGAGFTIV